MLKNSSLYNPRPHRNPIGVKNRRNVVLSQMSKYQYLEKNLDDSLRLEPLNLNYTPESHREGLATYFREFLRSHMKKWINDENNRKPDGSKYNLNTDGLKIYTTINYTMQQMAELAVEQHMPRLQKEFFEQNKTLIAVCGNTTEEAAKSKGLRIDIKAPTEISPSMAMAIDKYING